MTGTKCSRLSNSHTIRRVSLAPESTAPAHEHHTRRLLDAFELDHSVSQRSLARDLGIALGLTNLLVRRLVRIGWVRAIHIKPNRVRYLITPSGIAVHATTPRRNWSTGSPVARDTTAASRPMSTK